MVCIENTYFHSFFFMNLFSDCRHIEKEQVFDVNTSFSRGPHISFLLSTKTSFLKKKLKNYEIEHIFQKNVENSQVFFFSPNHSETTKIIKHESCGKKEKPNFFGKSTFWDPKKLAKSCFFLFFPPYFRLKDSPKYSSFDNFRRYRYEKYTINTLERLLNVVSHHTVWFSMSL